MPAELFLQALWWVSIGLAVVSLLLMVQLVIARNRHDRRERRIRERKVELSRRLFHTLEQNEAPQKAFGPLGDVDKELVGELVLDLLYVVRGNDATMLKSVLRSFEVDDVYLKLLSSGKPPRQLFAIAFLAHSDELRVRDALVAAAREKPGNIRLAAARALLSMGGPIDVKALIRGLEIGTVTRSGALRGLFERIAKDHRSQLAELLHETDREDERCLALVGLRSTGDPNVLGDVLPYADDPSTNVRAEAVRTLGVLEHPDAAPPILRALNDPSWEVRTQAAVATHRIKIESAIPVLVCLLDDPQFWVHQRAAEALAKLGERGVSRLREVIARGAPAAWIARLALQEQELE